jgi:hypothetical protein
MSVPAAEMSLTDDGKPNMNLHAGLVPVITGYAILLLKEFQSKLNEFKSK